MGGCIMYTAIRLLLLIHSFISSVFFLSNFQTLKFFVTLFLETVRPIKLTLDTHMDNGWMYRVYRNQAAASSVRPKKFIFSEAASYSFLYFFSFLSLQFSNIKIFRHTFLRNCEAYKVDTWYTHGQWVDVSCIPQSGCCFLFIPLSWHLIHTFLKVDTWYTRGQWVDVSCIPQSGCCFLFILLFLQFSFSPIFKH